MLIYYIHLYIYMYMCIYDMYITYYIYYNNIYIYSFIFNIDLYYVTYINIITVFHCFLANHPYTLSNYHYLLHKFIIVYITFHYLSVLYLVFEYGYI